jgi:hypothetical protein
MADLIEHEFEPWRYESGLVVCQHYDPEHPTRGMCDRPEDEHAPATLPAAENDQAVEAGG